MSNLAVIEAELQNIRAARDRALQEGNDTSGLDQTIRELEAQLGNVQVIEQHPEERVQQSVDAAAYILDSLDEEGFSMRGMCSSEDHYQYMRIKVQGAFAGLLQRIQEYSKELAEAKEQHRAEIKARDERDLSFQQQFNLLQRDYDQCAKESAEKSREIADLVMERNEALKTRDNAAAQLAEAQTEIQRLESHNTDLRQQLEFGARGMIKIINQEDHARELDELKQKIMDSKIRVTNMRYKDEIRKNLFVAELATTGETIEFPWTEKGKYLEVDAEEAARFRQEHDHANIPLDAGTTITPPPLEVRSEEPTFPEAPAIDSAVEGSPVGGESQGEDDQGAVSRAEFEALKADVEALKQVAGRWAA